MEQSDFPLMRERLEDLKNRLYVARASAREGDIRNVPTWAAEEADKVTFYRIEADRLRQEISEIEELLQIAQHLLVQVPITVAAAVLGAVAILVLVVLTTLFVNSVVVH